MEKSNFVEYTKEAIAQLLPGKESIVIDTTKKYREEVFRSVCITHDPTRLLTNLLTKDILAGVEVTLPNIDNLGLSYMKSKGETDPWKMYRDMRAKVAELSGFPEDKISLNMYRVDHDEIIKIYIHN